MKLIFATGNRHKLEEVQRMLPLEVTLVTAAECGITEDIPENEPTLEGNATAKSMYIYERVGGDCFADDTGLEVEALGGEPGVRSARYATDGHDFEANIDLLLSKLSGVDNRRARFRTVISLIINGEEIQFEGVVEGTIRHERSGRGGFGYDAVFEADGYDVTFAEMSLEDKNQISHRGLAVAKLVEYLTDKVAATGK